MLLLKDLIEKYKGQEEIYIIGTGPSARIFPLQILADKFTIGLNEAFKLHPCTINITIHPELITNHKLTCLTKIKGNYDYKGKYIFENTDDFKVMQSKSPAKLFVGRGIHTAAMHLASILGGNAGRQCPIWLVGVDCWGFSNSTKSADHHAFASHIQPHQFTMKEVYLEYYYYMVKCREILEKEYNVRFLSASGLLGECCREQDYQRQVRELPLLPKAKVIETNKRTTSLVTDYL